MSEVPQLDGDQLVVTEARLRPDPLPNRGLDPPQFAAFVLIDDPDGMRTVRDYYHDFFEIAQQHDAGLILGTPTWRANRDWGERLGYDPDQLAEANARWV